MKNRQNPSPPASQATNDPVDVLNTFPPRIPFSLVDPPLPWFQHNPLFHSTDLITLKKELSRINALEKSQKVSYDTSSLREQIRLIEKLNTPKDGVTFLLWEFERADEFQAELVYWLATQPENTEAFKFFKGKTYDYFWRLKRMAIAGHKEALNGLAKMAIEATEVINKQVEKQPDLFTTTASKYPHWPFLKSINKNLGAVLDNQVRNY